MTRQEAIAAVERGARAVKAEYPTVDYLELRIVDLITRELPHGGACGKCKNEHSCVRAQDNRDDCKLFVFKTA